MLLNSLAPTPRGINESTSHRLEAASASQRCLLLASISTRRQRGQAQSQDQASKWLTVEESQMPNYGHTCKTKSRVLVVKIWDPDT